MKTSPPSQCDKKINTHAHDSPNEYFILKLQGGDQDPDEGIFNGATQYHFKI
ncbi:MAG: hypothetical protein V5783_03545 [Pontiella sp.]